MFKILGAAVVKGRTYEDDDIAKLVGTNVGPYGSGWNYGGDQFEEESNFCLCVDGEEHVFDGRKGLPNLLKKLGELQD